MLSPYNYIKLSEKIVYPAFHTFGWTISSYLFKRIDRFHTVTVNNLSIYDSDRQRAIAYKMAMVENVRYTTAPIC